MTSLGKSAAYTVGYKYANQTLFTFVPLTLLVVFNSLLIGAVRTAARRRHLMSNGEQPLATRNPRHERHLLGQQRITVRSLIMLSLKLMVRGLSFWYEKLVRESWYKKFVRVFFSYKKLWWIRTMFCSVQETWSDVIEMLLSACSGRISRPIGTIYTQKRVFPAKDVPFRGLDISNYI